MELRVPRERIRHLLTRLDQTRRIIALEDKAAAESKATLPLDITKMLEFVSTLKTLDSGELSDQAKLAGIALTDTEVVVDRKVLQKIYHNIMADLLTQTRAVHQRSSSAKKSGGVQR